jgi:hypothetical protein
MRPRLRVTGVLLALVVGGLAASAARAQISPGPLSRPHATLEGNRNCLSCHRAGKGVDPGLCFDCHGALADRVAARQGLHADPAFARCERCHSEHNGVEFELVHFPEGEAGFDHGRTGWKLEGKHATVACRECHRTDRVDPAVLRREPAKNLARSFLGLPTACTGCHQDPHRGSMKAASCADCHSQNSWKEPRGFDHAATRFPLADAHARAACTACHKPEAGEERTLAFGQFAGVPLPACADCHRDPHRGKLGADCASCHSTVSFRGAAPARFDHDRTGWPLAGRHARVACAACHRPGRELDIPGADRCETCHRDPHAGQLRTVAGAPATCVTCHTVDGFLPARFGPAEHERSRFPLTGAHRAVPCTACHAMVRSGELPVPFRRGASEPVRAFRSAAAACADCHRDPHAGALAQRVGAAGCAACHDTASWRSVRFDHATTRFPLDGRHAAVACAKCHPDDAAGNPQLAGRPLECAACHADPHGAQLARAGITDCARCHGVAGFRPAGGFDHGRDSRFPLDGRHAAVACAGCHPTEGRGEAALVRYRPRPTDCAGCHATGEPR